MKVKDFFNENDNFNVSALQLAKFLHILVLQDDNSRGKAKSEKRW